MTERLVTIQNRAGIHARPAALIVQAASKFKSKVFLEKDSSRINGKSIMGILAMGATFNTPIRIIAEGEDEEAAADAIALLFKNRFEGE